MTWIPIHPCSPGQFERLHISLTNIYTNAVMGFLAIRSDPPRVLASHILHKKAVEMMTWSPFLLIIHSCVQFVFNMCTYMMKVCCHWTICHISTIYDNILGIFCLAKKIPYKSFTSCLVKFFGKSNCEAFVGYFFGTKI